jgi:hypothetical protein
VGDADETLRVCWLLQELENPFALKEAAWKHRWVMLKKLYIFVVG